MQYPPLASLALLLQKMIITSNHLERQFNPAAGFESKFGQNKEARRGGFFLRNPSHSSSGFQSL